jgi:hypothetical protein
MPHNPNVLESVRRHDQVVFGHADPEQEMPLKQNELREVLLYLMNAFKIVSWNQAVLKADQVRIGNVVCETPIPVASLGVEHSRARRGIELSPAR